jgi:hypothetical protein
MVLFKKIINSQNGYHPYEVVEQMAIVPKNILVDLNIS